MVRFLGRLPARRRRGAPTVWLLALPLIAGPALAAGPDPRLDAALAAAGANRGEIEAALARVAPAQRDDLRWLIGHMPSADLVTLDAGFLLEQVEQATLARQAAPWGRRIPDDIFRDAILPYASVNERRDRARAELRRVLEPLVAGAASPGCAAAILNRELFAMVGVRYSTGRPKAEQSPFESIEAGVASCTGLSLLLIEACRAVGVPARFAGTPLWSDGSGNHSWVEVWDGGWHFTGAAEPTGDELDRAWFTERAARAIPGDPEHAIYAVTWRPGPLHFPLVWSPDDRSVRAVDVTGRYAAAAAAEPAAGQAIVRWRVTGGDGTRLAARLRVLDPHGQALLEGTTRDERFDANDHLALVLPVGARIEAEASLDGRVARERLVVAPGESLIDLRLGP